MRSIKNSILLLLMLLYSLSSFTQQRTVISDEGDQQAHSSAVLELISDNKGFLLPRMTTYERDAIDDPAGSLLIYNTITRCFEIWMDEWHEIWCGPEPELLENPCEGLEGETYEYEIEYDGYVYKLVQIGGRCWFAENLKYDSGCTEVAWVEGEDVGWCGCYNDDCATYFDKYGYLYQWSAAMDWDREGDLPPAKSQGICPDGFHVPNGGVGYDDFVDVDCDWGDLTHRYLFINSDYHCDDDYSAIASSLADYSDEWDYSSENCDVGNNSAINNNTGFSGLPGGFVEGDKSFSKMGEKGFWWSSSGSVETWHRFLRYDSERIWYRLTFTSDPLVNYGYSLRCVRTLD